MNSYDDLFAPPLDEMVQPFTDPTPRPIRLKKVSDLDDSPIEWLVPNWIPKTGITMLSSDGGIGKTCLWCSIVSSLSRGQDTILRHDPDLNEKKTVLCFSGEDTENVLVLSFNSELSDILSEYGILRSVLMAGITMSLQGYFPWMNGVRCEMDGEAILAIVPVGLYDGANEVVSFDRGFMHWQDFSHFVLTEIALYYGNDLGGLSETRRYIPSSWANEPQQLLTQLFNGPSYYDSVTDLRPLFTGAETLEETLKRVETKENQLNLDFNVFFWDGKTDLNKEQNAVFAIVNTLTKLQWCRRVKLTVNGEAPQGQLAYETPFMRSMDYER